MPKKNGKVKTLSFSMLTLDRLQKLAEYYSLKQTGVIELLIAQETRRVFFADDIINKNVDNKVDYEKEVE